MKKINFHDNILKFNGIKKTFNYSIIDVLFLDNLFVVLLDPREDKKNWGQFHNLLSVDIEGIDKWIAELPTTDSGDSYYKIQLKNNELWAYSTCSYICKINPENGKIIERIFTK
ncbi:MAG: hypothetical protein K2X02_09170 [Alphaproteobacteria bacterium]|nr:hypothetical protein [Alphaproteobacteria bacterium]